MMNIKECSQCGCSRVVLIKSEILLQDCNMGYKLNWLCPICFLNKFRFYDKYSLKIDKSIAMRCANDKGI